MVKLLLRLMRNALLISLCALLLFTAYSSSQPMQVPGAPEGMSYFEFLADRVEAAKTVEPSRCGWGMMLSLAALGPIYATVYTAAAVNPDGSIARVTADDPNIARGATGAAWYQVPGIWWHTFERLSWTMLGKSPTRGCQLRPVHAANST